MKKIMLIGTFIILSMSVITAASWAAVAVGEQAPEFKVLDTNGKERSLSAYKAKYIVLEWFNHDCPFVKKHYGSGNMQALQKKYTGEGVIWLSVCSSAPGNQGYYEPEEANKLAQEKGFNSTAVILDPDGTLGRLFGAATTPHIFIIDPQGKLIYQGAVDSVPGTDQAELAEALNYVSLALDAAMNGNPVEIMSTKSYGCSVKY